MKYHKVLQKHTERKDEQYQKSKEMAEEFLEKQNSRIIESIDKIQLYSHDDFRIVMESDGNSFSNNKLNGYRISIIEPSHNHFGVEKIEGDSSE